MNLNNKIAAKFVHSLKKRRREEYEKTEYCEICEKFGHITKECWLNPKNKKSHYYKYYLKHQRKKNSKRRLKRTNKSNKRVETNFVGPKMVEDEYTNNFVDDIVKYWKDSLNRNMNINP
ncbi:hypothetical protein H8356DRAFT_1695100 [Neocallimastix lanati (nom. inval.)]|nr:hypothetical protein H8356DRAFT_1695100 [Neocallimastix sp. JGI-2020a]